MGIEPYMFNKKQLKRLLSSLRVVMTSAILVVLFIFITLISQSYLRLIEINATVDAFKTQAIPAVTNSSLLYSQINKLTYLSERMVIARNEPELRKTITDLESHLAEITKVALSIDDTTFFRTQLNTVIGEILELQELVKQNLIINQEFEDKQTKIYETYREILDLSKSFKGNLKQSKYFEWQRELADVLIPLGELNQTAYLHKIKKLGAHFETHLLHLENFWDTEQDLEYNLLTPKIANMRQLVLGPDGLVPLKKKITRLNGRLRGRANFMHNLIEDFSNQAEYSGYRKKTDVINKAKQQQNDILKQIKITGIMGSFAIVMLIAVLWLLHTRIVKRLILLKNNIKKKQQGDNVAIETKGYDEIADIAYSFNVYFKTVTQQKLILEELSLSDSLTNVPNRRAFDIRIENEWTTARREKWPMAVIMIDIDCFKLYNDNYGHGQGDKCLKQVAAALENAIPRSTDFIARYGGEEFSCILQNTSQEGALLVAERLVQSVYKQEILHDYSVVTNRVTVSVGVSFVDFAEEELSIEKLQIRADKALYKAKQKGRNQFHLYDSKTMT